MDIRTFRSRHSPIWIPTPRIHFNSSKGTGLYNLSTMADSKISWIEEELLSEHDSKRTFRTVIVQTEVERVKFLVRSYLRARMHKVPFPHVGIVVDLDWQVCSVYIIVRRNARLTIYWWTTISSKVSSSGGCRLTDRHNALLTSLYATAFTNSFPAHLRAFNDSRNEEMIEKPDMDKAVFCRVIRTPSNGGEIRFPKFLFLFIRLMVVVRRLQ